MEVTLWTLPIKPGRLKHHSSSISVSGHLAVIIGFIISMIGYVSSSFFFGIPTTIIRLLTPVCGAARPIPLCFGFFM